MNVYQKEFYAMKNLFIIIILDNKFFNHKTSLCVSWSPKDLARFNQYYKNRLLVAVHSVVCSVQCSVYCVPCTVYCDCITVNNSPLTAGSLDR